MFFRLYFGASCPAIRKIDSVHYINPRLPSHHAPFLPLTPLIYSQNMSESITNDQMDKSFLEASIPALLKELTVDEKISLLAGKDWWNTVPVPRLNVPSVKVTDGPNGARGGSFFNMSESSAHPPKETF